SGEPRSLSSGAMDALPDRGDPRRNTMKIAFPCLSAAVAWYLAALPGCLVRAPGPAALPHQARAPAADSGPAAAAAPAPGHRPLEPFLEKAVLWIVKGQHPDGGWGAGSHANQAERDPQAVVTDPATSAFTAMALLRAGHTPVSGEHREAVARAVERLIAIVEAAPADGPRITDLGGTQPQAKLGPYIDTSM